jgi:hypothetical protein
MNNKFGRDNRYRDDQFRRDRNPREPFWRSSEGDWPITSPDEEFETSGPYRQPREPYGETYTRREGRDYGRSSFDGTYAPSPYGSTGALSPSARRGYAGRGPKDYTRSDDRIREDVCDRLSWHDEVDATDITVRVANGEVTLEGSVETRHMKRLAEDIAEDVPGVLDVHNNVRVTKPILAEIREKLTGESTRDHYANTGTKTTGAERDRLRQGSP